MRFHTRAVCFCLFSVVLAVSPASGATCKNASLKGVFGYLHGRPGAYPAAVIEGQITLDGMGNITAGSWTYTYDGTITTGTTTGTYSISKNCTGTLTLNDEGGGPAHYNIYINAGNKMFQMIETDTGNNQPGFALAQGTVTCGLTGKGQVLTTNLVGYYTAVADTVGQVTLDGEGNIKGSEVFTNNGAISTLSVTGTYTEESNCTGTWQVTNSVGSTQNFNTVVVNSGKELLLIETDNGTITAGNAQE